MRMNFNCNLLGFKRRVTRYLLLNFSQFCQIDFNVLPSRSRRRSIKVKNFFSRTGESGNKTPWWSQVVWLLCVTSSIRLLVYDYFQFVYDRHSLQIRKLKETKLSSESNSSSLIETRLQQQIETYRSILKTIGAPYLNATFMVECPILLLICVTYYTYFQASFYFKYIHPIDLYFVRSVLNEESENLNCQELIKNEVDKVIASSMNFIDVCINLSLCNNDEESKKIEYTCDHNHELQLLGEKSRSELRKLIIEHKMLTEHLRQLVEDNELKPINRSPKWIDKMSTEFCLYSIGNFIYSIIFDSTLIIFLPLISGFKFETDWMDLISLVEILILTVASVIVIDFYLSLFVCICDDQQRLIDKTHDQLKACIIMNDAIFATSLNEIKKEVITGKIIDEKIALNNSNSYDKLDSIYRQMNANLLSALLRYKIFLAQERPIQKIFTFASLTALIVMFNLPVIVRIFIPYAPKEIRPLGIIFSFICCIFADLILIPICNFNQHGLRLNKALWSLAAHGIEVNEQSTNRPVYYKHTVWLLCKELSHPEILMNQFATNMFGFHITHPNIVKVHYWFSIIIISIFFEIESLHQMLGERMADPLGIYQMNE